MKCTRRKLADLDAVYVVGTMEIDGRTHLLAASEKRKGACLVFSPPDWRASVAWDEPGGAMSVTPAPGRRGEVLAIQRFFPIFESEEAGLYLGRAGEDVAAPWALERVVDLPFVHRAEVVEVGAAPWFVAASVCGGKAFRDDWSKPGAVVVGPVRQSAQEDWPATTVLDGVSRNHGMHVTALGGKPVVLITGDEGVFAIEIPASGGDAWRVERLLEQPTSDVFAADLDGDGQEELVTIEPFHGSRLAVYARRGGAWEAIYETELDFGHVVWAGQLLGAPAILAGSRGGAKELALLRVTGADPFAVERVVLDEGTGPTQVAVFRDGASDLILSANHGIGEVALYALVR